MKTYEEIKGLLLLKKIIKMKQSYKCNIYLIKVVQSDWATLFCLSVVPFHRTLSFESPN